MMYMMYPICSCLQEINKVMGVAVMGISELKIMMFAQDVKKKHFDMSPVDL